MVIEGVGASRAVGMAKAHLIRQKKVQNGAARLSPDQVEKQLERLHRTIQELERQYRQNLAQLEAEEDGGMQSDILAMHIALLHDAGYITAMEKGIRQLLHPADAVEQAAQAQCERLRQSGSNYLMERMQDVTDVANRLIYLLLHLRMPTFTKLRQPVVLVAQDIAPADMAMLDPMYVKGIVTAQGSPTSHTAILASAMGIPSVLGCGEDIWQIEDGEVLFVDGVGGRVEVAPSPWRLPALEERIQRFHQLEETLRDYRERPTVTADGTQVELLANIVGSERLGTVREANGDGVGLFRTEFLYQDQLFPPSEEAQYAAYRSVVEGMDGRPVTIRTMDIGADKEVQCLGVRQEPNPLLGCRGIRLSLALPDVFHTQLRAILRAASHGPVRILYPMIGGVEDLLAAQEQVRLARESLSYDGLPCGPVEEGIMVEIPSAALLSKKLLEHCDYVSIGTNDLSQYVLAADRLNAAVYPADASYDPALLMLIALTAKSCDEMGKACCVCGEMASDPLAIPLLLGLGVRHLSVSPASLLLTRYILSQLDLAEARSLAEEALALSTREAVRRSVLERLPWLRIYTE